MWFLNYSCRLVECFYILKQDSPSNWQHWPYLYDKVQSHERMYWRITQRFGSFPIQTYSYRILGDLNIFMKNYQGVLLTYIMPDSHERILRRIIRRFGSFPTRTYSNRISNDANVRITYEERSGRVFNLNKTCA